MTVNVTYREAGAVVPGATTIKNSPLSNGEIDGNFKSVKDAVEVFSTSAGAGLIGVAPVGGVVATTVQGAIAELDSEKVNTANLAAPSGSSLVGYDGGTVQDVLDGAKSLQDYTALRAYTGRAKRVYITGLLSTAKPAGIAGTFQHDPTDTASSDNGGTIIVGADNRRWKRQFDGSVNIKWFGAKGDWDGTTGTDDTAAIVAALNQPVRKLFAPPGKYRITSSLILNQDTIFEGAGGTQDPQDGGLVSQICIDGDFDGIAVKAGSYTGWITLSRLYVKKVGGTSKTNVGIKAAAFTPHVTIDMCITEGFDTGVDMWLGLANLRGVNSRFNNVGFKVKGTSFTLQNCYANRNVTGYRVQEQTVYSSLINCAADSNTGNAYEFIGTTGPYTTGYLDTNSVVQMVSCGAENNARYLYVDGRFDIDIASPTMDTGANSLKPFFATIESAKRVKFRGISKIPLTDWLNINLSKCTKDVLTIEGDLAQQNAVSPPTPTYTNIPGSVVAIRTNYGVMGLAKTRVPRVGFNGTGGVATGVYSTVERGVFSSQATAASKLRFRVKVLGNGFAATAKIRFSQLHVSGLGDAGGDVFLSVQNVGGIASVARSTSTDVTITRSTAASPDGYTYQYFDIESTRTFEYLWDADCFCNIELFQGDMFTEYNNWTVSRT